MKTDLKPLKIVRNHCSVEVSLLQLEQFGMFCLLQYHMTPNYYKHKILLPLAYEKAVAMDERQLFAAFDEYFKNK